MPYFKAKDTQVYYEKRGSGPLLLFISPPGLGTAVFEQQRALENDYCVVTFDPRGNGKSQSGDNYTSALGNWVEDTAELIDHLGGNVILCGYSLGGTPAQITALQYPEKVKALILINAFPVVNTLLLFMKFKLGIWSSYEDLRSVIAKVLSFSHTKKKDQQHRISANIKKSSSTVMKKMYKEGKKYDGRMNLPNIACPVFVVYGSADILTRKYVKDFRKIIPLLSTICIKGGTHQLPTKNADEMNGAIKQIKNNL